MPGFPFDYWYVGTKDGIKSFVNENELSEEDWRAIAPRSQVDRLDRQLAEMARKKRQRPS